LEKGALKNLIHQIRTKDSFVQNFAISFSGNAFAQVLGFLFTPFVARIYGPEAYGLFALFVAIVNNVAPVSTLQFPSGYVMARTQTELIGLFRMTLIVLLIFSFCTAIFAFFFTKELNEYFGSIELNDMIYLIPVSVFLMGFDYHMIGANLREKEFKRAAFAKLIAITISRSFTLVFGILAGPLSIGIIIGNMLQYAINATAMFSGKVHHAFVQIFDAQLKTHLKSILSDFKNYPLYVTPGVVISGLSMQLPVYFFSAFFSLRDVGHFTLANGVVSAPLSILLSSSNVVFLQKASETQLNNPDMLPNMVKKLYKRMFFFSIIPLVAFAFLSKDIFTIIFGTEWQQAGIYAGFLALSTLFCVNGPISVLFRVLNKQKLDFQLNIAFMIFKVIALLLGIILNNLLLSVVSYCVASWLCTAVSLIIIFKHIDLDFKIILRDSIWGIAFFALLIYFYL
jgi:lipopolysaccharide exporter